MYEESRVLCALLAHLDPKKLLDVSPTLYDLFINELND